MSTRQTPHSSASDLPDPIASESAAADIVRELLGIDDIDAGSILLLLCDVDHGPAVPVVIADPPADGPEPDRLDRMFGELESQFGGGRLGVIFARARRGQSYVVDADRVWHDVVARTCGAHGIRLHWAFVVTQHAVIPFPEPLQAVGAAQVSA